MNRQVDGRGRDIEGCGGVCICYLMEGTSMIQRSEDLTVVVPKVHRNTVVWIHGLNQFHEKDMGVVIDALKEHIEDTKIIVPRAPNRFVTVMNTNASSWFDVKPRSPTSFLVPFDEAFSTAQVNDSFERILKPIILKQSEVVKAAGGKIVVCGFSQGGGMSLHCLYSLPELVSAAVGISGYLFPFSPFDPAKEAYIIYGLADNLRPWQYTKTTYQGKIPNQKITLIEAMKHQVNENTKLVLTKKLQSILK